MLRKKPKKRIKPSSFTISFSSSEFKIIERKGKTRKVSSPSELNAWRKGENRVAIEIYTRIGRYTPYWRDKLSWYKSPTGLIPQVITLTGYDLDQVGRTSKTSINVDLEEDYLAFRLDLCGKDNIFRKGIFRKGRKSSKDEAMLRVYQPSWLWLFEKDISQSHEKIKTLSTTKVNFNPTNFRFIQNSEGKLLSFFDVDDKSRWHSGAFYHFWFSPEIIEGIEEMF